MSDSPAMHPSQPAPATSTPSDDALLVRLLAERSARRGEFKLSSGRTSTLYIDARLTTMSPDGLALIGPAGLAAIEGAGWRADATGRLIEGPFRAGDRVAVVEDVITTGGSALRAIAAVRAAGGEVAGVLALVDREEGGREALQAEGVDVRALI